MRLINFNSSSHPWKVVFNRYWHSRQNALMKRRRGATIEGGKLKTEVVSVTEDSSANQSTTITMRLSTLPQVRRRDWGEDWRQHTAFYRKSLGASQLTPTTHPHSSIKNQLHYSHSRLRKCHLCFSTYFHLLKRCSSHHSLLTPPCQY